MGTRGAGGDIGQGGAGEGGRLGSGLEEGPVQGGDTGSGKMGLDAIGAEGIGTEPQLAPSFYGTGRMGFTCQLTAPAIINLHVVYVDNMSFSFSQVR